MAAAGTPSIFLAVCTAYAHSDLLSSKAQTLTGSCLNPNHSLIPKGSPDHPPHTHRHPREGASRARGVTGTPGPSLGPPPCMMSTSSSEARQCPCSPCLQPGLLGAPRPTAQMTRTLSQPCSCPAVRIWQHRTQTSKGKGHARLWRQIEDVPTLPLGPKAGVGSLFPNLALDSLCLDSASPSSPPTCSTSLTNFCPITFMASAKAPSSEPSPALCTAGRKALVPAHLLTNSTTITITVFFCHFMLK